ncbi:hypothetical protein MSAN_01749500 [Mycena sanguinolenta]|uniref:Uncharacterized protein n=1 Tax=Mycena sanguinolenta TaxID=230812 RepID=A0A8H6XX33_9AGAR|nr:hypothetical protein MSAN_01749500 [Mycena sanguinolenta]
MEKPAFDRHSRRAVFRSKSLTRSLVPTHQAQLSSLSTGWTQDSGTLLISVVKKWLLLQIYSAGISVNSPNPDEDVVICTVFRNYDKNTGRHTLYLEGTVSPEISPCLHSRTSPNAVIDSFEGDYDGAAPGWLHAILHMPVFFLHDRAGFIGIFVNLALWPENLQANLSVAMIEWATAVSAGTWAASLPLGPRTPGKRTASHNYRPVRPCVKHNIYSRQESLALRDSSPICIMDGDYESDESEDGGYAAESDDEYIPYELEPLHPLDTCT